MENTEQRGRESLQRGNTVVGRANTEKLPVTQNPELPEQLKLQGTVGTNERADAEASQQPRELTQKSYLSCRIQNCQNSRNCEELPEQLGELTQRTEKVMQG